MAYSNETFFFLSSFFLFISSGFGVYVTFLSLLVIFFCSYNFLFVAQLCFNHWKSGKIKAKEMKENGKKEPAYLVTVYINFPLLWSKTLILTLALFLALLCLCSLVYMYIHCVISIQSFFSVSSCSLNIAKSEISHFAFFIISVEL